MFNYLWDAYEGTKNYAVENPPHVPALEKLGSQNGDGAWLINPLPRFGNIFRPLYTNSVLAINDEEIKCRTIFANIAFHILAQKDILMGYTRTRLEQAKILTNLSNGLYGEAVKKIFHHLTSVEKQNLAGLLLKQEKDRRCYFLEALKTFFPASIVYHHRRDNNLPIFLPYEETEKNKKLLYLIEYLFCDLSSAERKYFWSLPFGIFGQDATLMLDHFVLF